MADKKELNLTPEQKEKLHELVAKVKAAKERKGASWNE